MRVEINRPTTWHGAYRVELVEQAIQPLVDLDERLRVYLGYPNNEATRAMIQNELDRWNLEYHDNITIDDLNLE